MAYGKYRKFSLEFKLKIINNTPGTVFFIVLIFSKELNVLAMGEEMAVYSGLNPESIKMLLILTTVLSVSFTVSQVGIIGFVGLIIPHIVRMIKGPYSFISNLHSIFLEEYF